MRFAARMLRGHRVVSYFEFVSNEACGALKLARWSLLGAGLAIFTWRVVATWAFTVDDAYITLCYSSNLASHCELTFNSGQPPVEGFTAFLWVIVLAIPHLLGLDPVLFAKVAGIASSLLTLAVVFRLTATLLSESATDWSKCGGAVAAGLMAATPATAIHAVSGMETSTAMLLMTCFCLSAVRWLQRPGRVGAYAIAVLSLLIGLIRPDGNVACLASLLTLYVMSDQSQRATLLRATLIGYVLPGVGYFLLRYLYFDALLPIPFQVKLLNARALSGLGQVARFLLYHCVPVAIPILVAVSHRRREIVPLLAAACSLGIFFLFPAHIMGFDSRYLYPVMPIVAVLAGYGTVGLPELFSRLWPRNPRRNALVVMGVIMLGFGGLNYETAGSIDDKVIYAEGLRNAHQSLAQRLSAIEAEPHRVWIAIGDVGAVAYVSNWNVLDLYGLNDRHLASAANDEQYVYDCHPDVIVLASETEARFEARSELEARLYSAPELEAYSEIKKLRFGSHYFLWVFAKSGTAIADSLQVAW